MCQLNELFEWTPFNHHWHTVTHLSCSNALVTDTLVILGSGYTAKFVWPLASARYQSVLATSRQPDKHLSDVPSRQRVRFDLSEAETWRNIPEGADLLWCFPAEPLVLVRQFAERLNPLTRRIVVLGSTSAYDHSGSHDYPPPWIDESASLDLTKTRVEGEEFLRRQGSIVLRVTGIYGPARNPIEWIKSGRVGPSRKYVNLVHVEDLAAICLTALEHGTSGEAYNVSDGTPRTWQDICDQAQARWDITSSRQTFGEEAGKRISNHKLTQSLGYAIQHPDLFKELERL